MRASGTDSKRIGSGPSSSPSTWTHGGSAWVAVASPDPVVAEDYYRQGIEINKQLARERATLPAMQARNHAATPAKP